MEDLSSNISQEIGALCDGRGGKATVTGLALLPAPFRSGRKIQQVHFNTL
jgi:hypothetical protein